MERFYRIAGLTVQLDSFGRTMEQAGPYACEPQETVDMLIKGDGQKLQENQPHLTLDDAEYISTGGEFYRKLMKFDGMLLHASAVVVDGRAYLFSASSGTGKSTHTGLWLKQFGDRAFLLNDDKPALRLENGTWYAYGTPWSGKYDISVNCRVPVAGIAMVERGEENRIEPFGGSEAIHAILEQTLRPNSMAMRIQLLELMDKLLRGVPVWRLHCNMDPSAVKVSYEAMTGQAL